MTPQMGGNCAYQRRQPVRKCPDETVSDERYGICIRKTSYRTEQEDRVSSPRPFPSPLIPHFARISTGAGFNGAKSESCSESSVAAFLRTFSRGLYQSNLLDKACVRFTSKGATRDRLGLPRGGSRRALGRGIRFLSKCLTSFLQCFSSW